MKKVILAITAVFCFSTLSAEVVEVKDIYDGAAKDVTWESPLQIDAAQFADGVKVGNYISIDLANATDVLEIKADGKWLPGSRFTNIEGATEYKAYITADMLAALRTYGLEIVGRSFTVNDVKIMDDGFSMPEGAIWGGYFWVENWNTIEIFKTAFDNYANQRYLEIYFTDENDGATNYFIKVLTKWDDPNALWAENGDITHEVGKAVVDLKNINVKDALADVDKLMIQSNPEGLKPYNITAVVLRNDNSSGIDNAIAEEKDGDAPVVYYTLQGNRVVNPIAGNIYIRVKGQAATKVKL